MPRGDDRRDDPRERTRRKAKARGLPSEEAPDAAEGETDDERAERQEEAPPPSLEEERAEAAGVEARVTGSPVGEADRAAAAVAAEWARREVAPPAKPVRMRGTVKRSPAARPAAGARRRGAREGAAGSTQGSTRKKGRAAGVTRVSAASRGRRAGARSKPSRKSTRRKR